MTKYCFYETKSGTWLYSYSEQIISFIIFLTLWVLNTLSQSARAPCGRRAASDCDRGDEILFC